MALNRGSSIVAESLGCDLFINNAYGNGMQTELVNQLYSSVSKMIVIGSCAADYPDTTMLAYSKHKKELKDRVLDIVNSSIDKADILLLQLTGESYNDSDLITRSIEFWLSNPKVTCINFIPGNPNR